MSQTLEVEISKVLEEYVKDVDKIAGECMRETAKEAVEKLKATSPRKKGGGRYARGWTMSEERGYTGTDYIVHNKQYQLTHLLEHGHAVSNQYGATGRRAAAHPHIEPVEQWAIAEVENKIVGRLES